MQKTSGRRVYFLDLLRLMAFMLIILFHFMQDLEIKSVYEFLDKGVIYYNANIHIATFAVGAFFMISGAGLMLSAREGLNLKEYYRKRILRVLIPFWIVYLVYFAILLIVRGTPFAQGTPVWRVVFTVLGMDEFLAGWGVQTFSLGIGEWFLGALIILYVIFPLLRYCMLKNKWVTMLAATAYWLILLSHYDFPMGPHLNIFVKLYDFMMGMFLILIWERVGRISMVLTIPVTGAFLFCKASFPLPAAVKITIFCTAVFLLAAQAETLLSKVRFLDRILLIGRKYSFELFLVHHIIIYAFSDWLIGRILVAEQIVLLFIGEFACMCLAAVLVRFAEDGLLKKLNCMNNSRKNK